MTHRGGIQTWFRPTRLAAGIAAAVLTGAAIAGWQAQRATDTTLIEPIPLPVDLVLKDGDIIMAGGVSLQSRMVRALTDDNRHSHVGLIDVRPDGIYVIHAAPTGQGDGGLGDRVASIPLELFLSERGYITAQVVRLSERVENAAALVDQAVAYSAGCADRAVPFDNSFDLDEDETIYCSELIYLAYQAGGYDWPDTLVSNVSTLVVEGPVILPGAFASCTDFTTIWQY